MGKIGRAVAAELFAAGWNVTAATAAIARLIGVARFLSEYLPQHGLAADAADIDLDVEAPDRRPRVMPGETVCGRAAPHELVGEGRVDVEDGVELGRGDVGPRAAECRHPPLHGAEHKA